MCPLAKLLLGHGAIVSGSDMNQSDAVKELSFAGAQVAVGHAARNIPEPVDLIVITAALGADNPELAAARRRGLTCIKYAQLLGQLMNTRRGVAVAGTHGKSTTSAMVTTIFRRAGLDPSFLIGAVVPELGGASGTGSGDFFIAEACEFDRSFLNLHPQYAAILNAEADHLDCYGSHEKIMEAYGVFARQVSSDGAILVNHEDRHAMKAAAGAPAPLRTFGLTPEATYYPKNLEADLGRFRFDLCRKGGTLTPVALQIPGRHTVYNALAAAALAVEAGIEPAPIGEALSAFAGIERRMELIAQTGGITLLDDYAHHPTEIQVTLRAARDRYQPKRIFTVFQPHQHSRTRIFLDDFARSFGLTDVVIVPDIYFVRDSEAERTRIGAADLVERIHSQGGEAVYMSGFDEIVAYLQRTLQSGDLSITMGAGDVWKVAHELARKLG